MTEDYRSFRFRNSELFSRYSEKTVRFVFEQVSFFLDYFSEVDFSTRELCDFVNESAKSSRIMLPDDMELIDAVMDYFCDELELCRSFRNNYQSVHEIVSGAVMRHLDNGNKFIDPLTSAIIDEFDSSSYSTTMEEIASRLKKVPSLRFLSSALISDAVNSVYDYFEKESRDI